MENLEVKDHEPIASYAFIKEKKGDSSSFVYGYDRDNLYLVKTKSGEVFIGKIRRIGIFSVRIVNARMLFYRRSNADISEFVLSNFKLGTAFSMSEPLSDITVDSVSLVIDITNKFSIEELSN